MHLKWQTSPSYDASFINFKNNSFEMNQYTSAKVGFGSGQKLDGMYSATVVGNQMRIQAYAFHSDGTYQFSDKPVTSKDGPLAGSAGRYRVFGSTLELSGASGTTRATAYTRFSVEGSASGELFSVSNRRTLLRGRYRDSCSNAQPAASL